MKSFQEQDHALMGNTYSASHERITSNAEHDAERAVERSADMTQTATSSQTVFDAKKACMRALEEVNASFSSVK